MKESLPVQKIESHLTPGINPIIACIGSPEHFEAGKKKGGEGLKSIRKRFHPKLLDFLYRRNAAHNVNYHKPENLVRGEKFFNAGECTYVISPLDSKNKFSEGYHDCTGLVVSGISRTTGKKVSFISHQDPKEFLFDSENGADDVKGMFAEDLKERLAEVKESCKPGTIDAVVIGGMYATGPRKMDAFTTKNYRDSLQLLSKEVKDILGFDPTVVNGPKHSDNSEPDDIYYENETKRLYFIRPEVTQVKKDKDQDFQPADFPAEEVDKYEGKWGYFE